MTEANESGRAWDADELVEVALVAAGHHPDEAAGLGLDDIREPLGLICTDMAHEAQLIGDRAWFTRTWLLRLLTSRIALHTYEASDPAVADEAIVEPVFVIGAPRTGTTALHRTLTGVPHLRAPEGWELLFPTPPPEPDTFATDGRVGAAASELTFPQRVSGEITAIHRYSARMPKECLSAMSLEFRSEEFVSRYRLPGYVEWLQSCDMGPAYDMHRRVLRVLQRRMPSRRWVLKSPVHLQNLGVLAATYPDARLIVTHREPGPVLSSTSSLIGSLRSAFSADVDLAEIGRYHLDLYARSLNGLADGLESAGFGSDRVAHVHHADVVADVATAVAGAATQLGIALDDADLVAIAEAAASGAERSDAPGGHRHDLATFGLDAAAVKEAFSTYRSAYIAPAAA